MNDYIPDFNFIAQDTKEKRIARPPLADEIQFPFKEYYRTENPTIITDELYFYNGFIEEGGPVMAGKYNKIGMDWSDYCLLYTSPSPRDQRGSGIPSWA